MKKRWLAATAALALGGFVYAQDAPQAPQPPQKNAPQAEAPAAKDAPKDAPASQWPSEEQWQNGWQGWTDDNDFPPPPPGGFGDDQELDENGPPEPPEWDENGPPEPPEWGNGGAPDMDENGPPEPPEWGENAGDAPQAGNQSQWPKDEQEWQRNWRNWTEDAEFPPAPPEEFGQNGGQNRQSGAQSRQRGTQNRQQGTSNRQNGGRNRSFGGPGGGPGGPGGPGGMMDKASVAATAVYLLDGSKDKTEVTLDAPKYEATKKDESAIRLENGAIATMKNVTATKTGNVSNEGESNFYALNAVVAAMSGSKLVIEGGTFTSDARGANGFFASGKGSEVTVSDATFTSSKSSSRGLDATYGGKVTGNRLTLKTQGAHCATLATDRGEGFIIANSCKGETHGEGSPCVYSTGDITLNDCQFIAYGSEAGVIEGKNSITLVNSTIEGKLKCGVMLYQSFSGDAGVGTSVLNVTDSTIKATIGPMFYITNTRSKVFLKNATLEFASGKLIRAQADRWGRSGRNGGSVEFHATSQKLVGSISADSISTITLKLDADVTLDSAINEDGKAKAVNLSLLKNSTWSVAADSHLTALDFGEATAADAVQRIQSNGHSVTYDASASPALEGKTYDLPGGGKLAPAK